MKIANRISIVKCSRIDHFSFHNSRTDCESHITYYNVHTFWEDGLGRNYRFLERKASQSSVMFGSCSTDKIHPASIYIVIYVRFMYT